MTLFWKNYVVPRSTGDVSREADDNVASFLVERLESFGNQVSSRLFVLFSPPPRDSCYWWVALYASGSSDIIGLWRQAKKGKKKICAKDSVFIVNQPRQSCKECCKHKKFIFFWIQIEKIFMLVLK